MVVNVLTIVLCYKGVQKYAEFRFVTNNYLMLRRLEIGVSIYQSWIERVIVSSLRDILVHPLQGE